MRGTVRALFLKPGKKAAPVAQDVVRVGATGFEGDFHAGTANRRQVLILSKDVLAEFGLEPGSLHENMVVDGIDVMALPAGRQLRVGETILEVTLPCEPCIQMDRIRNGLRKALDGKRGMFARVVNPGTIRVGDVVEA